MVKEKTIGQIVADDIRTANVFKKYGLDFCCGGGVTVQSACAESGVDITELLKVIVMNILYDVISGNVTYVEHGCAV